MRISILLFILVTIAACGGEKIPELHSDPALLGPEKSAEALGIAFRAPLAFQEAPPGYLERSQKELEATPQRTEPWFIMPQLIYGIPNANGRCFVSNFPNQHGAAFDDSWRARYLEAAQKLTAPVEVEPRTFRAGKETVYSYTIRNAGLINQRFLLTGSGGQIIQVDFLMPVADWEPMAPAIESAVASIRRL